MYLGLFLIFHTMLHTNLAAVSKSSSKKIPSLPSTSFLAAGALVPLSLMTIFLDNPIYSTQFRIDLASSSHLTIPPKMLTKITLTLSSVSKIFIASVIYVPSALPPISKKFAGSPPWSLTMSIVDIARPAPLTRQPMFPPM